MQQSWQHGRLRAEHEREQEPTRMTHRPGRLGNRVDQCRTAGRQLTWRARQQQQQQQRGPLLGQRPCLRVSTFSCSVLQLLQTYPYHPASGLCAFSMTQTSGPAPPCFAPWLDIDGPIDGHTRISPDTSTALPRRQADPPRHVSTLHWPVNYASHGSYPLPLPLPCASRWNIFPHPSHGHAARRCFLLFSSPPLLSLPLPRFEPTAPGAGARTPRPPPTGRSRDRRATMAVPASSPPSDGRAAIRRALGQTLPTRPPPPPLAWKRCAAASPRSSPTPLRRSRPSRRTAEEEEPRSRRGDPPSRGLSRLPRDRRPRLLPRESSASAASTSASTLTPSSATRLPHRPAATPSTTPPSSPTVEAPHADAHREPASPTSATEPRISTGPTAAPSRHGDRLFFVLPLL